MEIRGSVSRLIREGFWGKGQSQAAWTEGRDDRWRLIGGWGGERCGRTCAWGSGVNGVMSGLCQGGRKSAGQVWGLGVGWSAEAVSWQH